jgi:hypothetical protein
MMQSTFGKTTPPEKDLARKEMFIKRRKVIEKHNLENNEWKRGLNKFTDMVSGKEKKFYYSMLLMLGNFYFTDEHELV